MAGGKHSKLALVAAGVGGAAIAGYGLAFGRDMYKETKKNVGLIVLVLIVVFCPFIGGRGMVRGHDRGLIGTLFLTFIGSTLLIAAGFCAAAMAVFAVTIMGEVEPDVALPMALVGGFTVTAVITGIGVLVGLFQRTKRLKAFAATRANERFLADNGFRETDGKDITHYDASGQALRFLEAHSDRLVFMAVGLRGKRAYINLDQDGRMVSYSGVQ